MIIGFTRRNQTTSEGMARPGEDSFPLSFTVSTLRTAEREHPIIFRLQESASSASVEPLAGQTDPHFDAVFGSRDSANDPIKVFFVLETLADNITPLTAFITNDLRPEKEECFTIRLFPVDVPGRRELFTCNEDDVNAKKFFCEHTICIDDDDGKLFFQLEQLIIF